MVPGSFKVRGAGFSCRFLYYFHAIRDFCVVLQPLSSSLWYRLNINANNFNTLYPSTLHHRICPHKYPSNPTMAKTTSPYNISVTETERRRSQDSNFSQASTAAISSQPSSSTYARSNLSYDPDEPPAYSEETAANEEQMESFKQMEEEKNRRIRDYATQISRLMGRQLVNGLNRNGKHNATVAEIESRARS